MIGDPTAVVRVFYCPFHALINDRPAAGRRRAMENVWLISVVWHWNDDA
jgi:hypothetical protein